MEIVKVDIAKLLSGPNGPFELDVSFSLKQGDFLGIYGESGAGKTSILNMMAGLLDPDHGSIRVNGKLWNGLEKAIPANKRSIGYVFQEGALFPNMSVIQNIRFAATGKEELVDELIELIELKNLANKKPSTLSGGQQQRVALARAVARRPTLLLLDEPFSSVDDEMRSKLQDITLELHRRFQTTSIIVSHDLGELYKLTNKIMSLQNGRLIAIESADSLFTDRSISGKFKFSGQILEIKSADIVATLGILVGNNLIKVVVTKDEAETLNIGENVLVVSKAFNPVIIKKTN